MTKMYSLVSVGALLAVVFNLVNADAVGVSTVLKTFPSGFELRLIPRDWVCCATLVDLSSMDESEKVVIDFANGNNDQNQKIVLSPATIAGGFVAGAGVLCRFVENESTGTVLTSPTVMMIRASAVEYYAKKVEKGNKEGILAAFEDLKMAVAKAGGPPKSLAWFKLVVVEKTPEGVIYVGTPNRPY